MHIIALCDIHKYLLKREKNMRHVYVNWQRNSECKSLHIQHKKCDAFSDDDRTVFEKSMSSYQNSG